MQIHNITREHPNKKARRVGRGGKRGKTAGRGTKGQKARAGSKLRPEARDQIKKIPKRRGYGKNRSRTVNAGRVVYAPVNLKTLEASFEEGARVTPSVLLEKKLVRRMKGKVPAVKILGTGELKKKLIISKCVLSKSAREQLEKTGGKVV